MNNIIENIIWYIFALYSIIYIIFSSYNTYLDCKIKQSNIDDIEIVTTHGIINSDLKSIKQHQRLINSTILFFVSVIIGIVISGMTSMIKNCTNFNKFLDRSILISTIIFVILFFNYCN